MKNIHLLSTLKPSRLLYSGNNKNLLFSKEPISFRTFERSPQNIYITNSEEIKEGDWFFNPATKEALYASKEMISWNCDTTQEHKGWKKIILTTDQDLIKDGVQAIDDEFLEWFVKNPSCEYVDVNDWMDTNGNIAFGGNIRYQISCSTYKEIIIPQEEPKYTTSNLDNEKYKDYSVSKEEPKQNCENCKQPISKYGCACGIGKEESKQEIWKDIPNYESLYQVSNFGNVKSLERYVKGKVENRLQKENILSKRLVGGKGNQYYSVTLCNNKDRKQIKVSVLVAMAFLNHIPNGYVGFTVDHIDNNPLNNNVNNLQVITKRENSSKDRKGISKYTGVTFNKKSNKWRSQIWIDGKNKTLGSFDDELEAHRAYQKELQQHLKS
jgi:hypothetical protein